MNHLASGIQWDDLINATAPEIGADGTIGSIVSGKGRYPGLVFFITVTAGLAFIIYLIMGGIQLMTSAGDPKKIETGKKTITNALIGLLFVFFAYWIVQIVGLVLGLDTVLSVF